MEVSIKEFNLFTQKISTAELKMKNLIEISKSSDTKKWHRGSADHLHRHRTERRLVIQMGHGSVTI